MARRKRRKQHKGKSNISKRLRRLIERAFALDRKRHEPINIDSTGLKYDELQQVLLTADTEEMYRIRMAGESKRDLMRELERLERIANAAMTFCREVQEDADGIPQKELRELNAALDYREYILHD